MPCAGCQKRKEFLMKYWHWILLAVVAYIVGVKFPGPGRSALSKIGM